MRKLILVAALLLSACQTASQTPSGSPEVTISGVRPEQVKPRLVNYMLNKGLRLKSDSAYAMVFERAWPNKVMSGLTSVLITNDLSEPAERLQVTIADTPAGTRIVADRQMVRYPGTPRETVGSANNAPGLDSLQDMLDRAVPELKR